MVASRLVKLLERKRRANERRRWRCQMELERLLCTSFQESLRFHMRAKPAATDVTRSRTVPILIPVLQEARGADYAVLQVQLPLILSAPNTSVVPQLGCMDRVLVFLAGSYLWHQGIKSVLNEGRWEGGFKRREFERERRCWGRGDVDVLPHA